MKFERLTPVEFSMLGSGDPQEEIDHQSAIDLIKAHLATGMPDLIVSKVTRTQTKHTIPSRGKNCRIYNVVGFLLNQPVSKI